MHKRYADTPDGQVHCRIWPGGEASAPPLLCLHAIPYSGLHFAALAPLLARERTVICPDYPGYGGSDPCSGRATVEDYATAMLACLDDLGVTGPCDLLGFHTGCLVGPELALLAPDRIRRLVLIDVPCFAADQRREFSVKTGEPPGYTAELDSLAPAWTTNVASKLGQLDMDRCLELLAEQLRTGLEAHAGFEAAFAYPCDERLPRLRQPCLLIATRSALAAATRSIAGQIPGARLLELPGLGPPALDAGAAELAAASRAFLDEPGPPPPN
jgi:pimeloyl-ACP methyl ester carboxylesterase